LRVPVGREAVLGDAAQLLAVERLVTLTGPAGVGKSHLARAIVDVMGSSAGPVAWADVHTSDHTQLADAIARALVGAGFGARDAIEAAVAAVGSDPVLLVLDGLDHVGDRAVVSTLLDRCAGLRVLATSQRRLGVRDERVVLVAPLSLAPVTDDPTSASAVQLLVELAERSGIAVDRDRDAAHLVAVCEQCAGLPWAIELVESWLAVYKPAELAAALRQSVDLYAGGRPDMADRHRDLESLVEWSTRGLDDDERDVLALLALVPGPASRDLLSTVLGRSVDRQLRALVDLHHALPVLDERQSRSFEMLGPVRLFLTQKSDERSNRCRALLVDHVIRVVDEHGAALRAPQCATAIEQLTAINPLLALAFAQLSADRDGSLVPMLRALVPYWAVTGRHVDGIKAATMALPVVADVVEQADVLRCRARLRRRGCDRAALADARRALDLASQAGASRPIADAAEELAVCLAEHNAGLDALELLERTVEELGDESSVGLLIALVGARANEGDPATAACLLDDLDRRWGDSAPIDQRIDRAGLGDALTAASSTGRHTT
jgi:energy-coupling factor transporter ATP-binding protein EcfA2